MMRLPDIMVLAFDLAYLKTGWAVVGQPGELVCKYGVIEAKPLRPKGGVTEYVGIERAHSAYEGFENVASRIGLFNIDAIVYEMPKWIGGKHRGRGSSTNAVLALGAARERMRLAINDRLPIFALTPEKWQVPFVGVYPRQIPKGAMKGLVRKQVKLRAGLELSKKEHDAADAIGLGLVAANMILQGVLELEESE